MTLLVFFLSHVLKRKWSTVWTHEQLCTSMHNEMIATNGKELAELISNKIAAIAEAALIFSIVMKALFGAVGKIKWKCVEFLS